MPSFSFRFGRKKIVFISIAAQCASVLLQSFSYSWRMFCIMFLFVGASQISLYISAFVLGMNYKPFFLLLIRNTCQFLNQHLHFILSWTGTEVLSKTMRVIFTTLGAFLFYCLGYMTLPWIAYGIREWRTLLAVLSMTSVVYIPLWWSASHHTDLIILQSHNLISRVYCFIINLN